MTIHPTIYDLEMIAHAENDIEEILQELDNTNRKRENEHEKNKHHGRITITTKAVYVNGIQHDQVDEYVYLGQRFTVI